MALPSFFCMHVEVQGVRLREKCGCRNYISTWEFVKSSTKKYTNNCGTPKMAVCMNNCGTE